MLTLLAGPQVFARYAYEVASPLENLRDRHPNSHNVFIHRLTFAVQYAQFHQLLGQGAWTEAASDLLYLLQSDVTPRSWWPILLCDSLELLQYGKCSRFFPLISPDRFLCSESSLLISNRGSMELLRKIEEVFVRTSQGSGRDYLSVLQRLTPGAGEKDALERLKTVRLALAKYIARCTISGSVKIT